MRLSSASPMSGGSHAPERTASLLTVNFLSVGFTDLMVPLTTGFCILHLFALYHRLGLWTVRS